MKHAETMQFAREGAQPPCKTCILNGAAPCPAMILAGGPGARPPRIAPLARDHTLFEQGEAPRMAGVLRRGYLRMERMQSDGHRSILGLVSPGDLVGLLELGQPGYSLQCATDVEICVLDRTSVLRLRKSVPEIARVLFEEACRMQASAQDLIWRRGALSARERILAFLSAALHIFPTRSLPGGGVEVEIPVSRRDWADLANTTVESISRTLRQVAEIGVVETVGPGRYRVTDPVRLARLAGLDPACDGATGSGVTGSDAAGRRPFLAAVDAAARGPDAQVRQPGPIARLHSPPARGKSHVEAQA